MTKSKMNKKNNNPTNNNATKKHTLLSDSANYKETLQTYYRYMHRIVPQTDWMTYKFGMRIRDIFDMKKDIKILAVGSGTGEMDIDFLNEIVRCGKERLGEDGYTVLYQVVEPNPSNVEFFRKTVEKNPEYKRIQFKWFTGYFEKFCDNFKQRESESNKFDFAHFVRVFYHVNSVEALDLTYNHLLAKKGIMCVIGENENTFWPKLMYFFADRNMEHEAFMGSETVSPNYFLQGWQQQARDRNWRYESYIHAYNFEITPMYDPSSKDGNQLLDFVMHAKSARKTVKKQVIDDFFKLLDDGKVEKEIMQNGTKVKKIDYPCEFGAIMITKD